MRIPHVFLAILLLVGLSAERPAFATTVPAVPDDQGAAEERVAAQAAVDALLSRVDERQTAQLWADTHPIFKASAGSADNWRANLSAMRANLGAVKTRRLQQMGFTDGLGDIPEGRYCVLLYTDEFEKAQALEQVMMALDNGRWRLTGHVVSRIQRHQHSGEP
jgi:hypothetical protein